MKHSTRPARVLTSLLARPMRDVWLLLVLAACSRGRAIPDGASAAPVAGLGTDTSTTTPGGSVGQPVAGAAPHASGAGVDAGPPASASSSAIKDEEFGKLIARLSEPEGDFPSDNFVSNETSYLDVTPALDQPALRGAAYVGVGPEQNFTYVALLEPSVAFVIDLRRENLVLHLVYKTVFERSADRATFLATLTSRRTPTLGEGSTSDALVRAVAAAPRDPDAPRALVMAVSARAGQLGVVLSSHDRAHLAKAVDAFAREGLGLHYTMAGSSRPYPTLGQLIAAPGEGRYANFLAGEASYRAVRTLELENRVVPVVGDLSGRVAMGAIGRELAQRGTPLGVIYASNVEQYLIGSREHWAGWLRNLRGLPAVEGAEVVRVYLDQGRPHPAQRPGSRSTSVTMPLAAFLAKADAGGWGTWYALASDTARAATSPPGATSSTPFR